MTPNFAEQAEKYAWKDQHEWHSCNGVSLAPVREKAFLAGCDHGYRVGKAERDAEIDSIRNDQLYISAANERDQLKAQISESESAYRVLARTEEMFRKELIAERNLMQAQLAVAEEILSQMTCAGPNHGGAIKMAYDYFSKRGAR